MFPRKRGCGTGNILTVKQVSMVLAWNFWGYEGFLQLALMTVIEN